MLVAAAVTVLVASTALRVGARLRLADVLILCLARGLISTHHILLMVAEQDDTAIFLN